MRRGKTGLAQVRLQVYPQDIMLYGFNKTNSIVTGKTLGLLPHKWLRNAK